MAQRSQTKNRLVISRQDFWCQSCRQDIDQVFCVLSGGYWLHRHQCRKISRNQWLVRFAENPLADPYFRLSRKIRVMADAYADDLIQATDPRFKYKYPAQYAKMEMAEQLQKARAIAEAEEDWRYAKFIEDQFGPKGKEAIDVLSREHPALMNFQNT